MLKIFWTFLKENLILVGILLCVSFSILSCSYFFGYRISPDASHYLRATKAILQGNGFYVYPGWFAIWPIGYPFLIAVTSFITHTELYLASKILSIIIVWIIGFSLFKRFGRAAWAYALVMFNFGFLSIFYSTWSEVPFILGLILFSFWVSDIITKDDVNARQYVKLTFAALLLFLSRYIGAFSLGVIGLLWLYNMYLTCRYKDRTAWKRIKYITASGAVSGIAMLSYLLLNQKMTGYMTGPRRANQTKDLFLNLCDAQLTEMNNVFTTFFKIDSLALALPLWFCFFAFVLYMLFKKIDTIKARDKNIVTPITFIVMGGLYWCSIVAMRFSSEFDNFSLRLLFPSSILLFIGFVGLLSCHEKIHTFFVKFSGFSSSSNNMEKCNKSEQTLTVWVISFFFLFTMTTIVVMPGFTSKTPSYKQTRELLLSRYADIPDGSTVLWGYS